MKFKIIVLGVCAMLSGCGLLKGNRVSQGQDEVLSADLFLTSIKAEGYAKIRETESGTQLYSLGVFEAAELPVEIKELATESEIGTLSVDFEDEVYQVQYAAEVFPIIKNRQEKIKTTVYLQKLSNSSGQIMIAIRNDEIAKKLKLIEQAITIQSSPVEFCDLTHIPYSTGEGANVPDQSSACDVAGFCAFTIQYTGAFKRGESERLTRAFSLGEIERSCLHHATHYRVSESRLNRFVPKVATVQLRAGISKSIQRLIFDL